MNSPGSAEHVADIRNKVAQDDAPQNTVKAEQQKGYQRLKHTVEGKPGICRPVGFYGSLAGLAAQGQFPHQQRIADDYSHDKIDNKEDGAAVGAHFIRKSPDVAQTDGYAHRGHQETEV